jgi:hypothetical protein
MSNQEISGGKVGRGSENKVPFVAALSLDEEDHPLRIKLKSVSGFTKKPLSRGLKLIVIPIAQADRTYLSIYTMKLETDKVR